jgi:hypothetical protein
MAKTLEKEVQPEQLPQRGGSYTVQEDGSLQRDDANSTSPAANTAATYPKKEKGE